LRAFTRRLLLLASACLTGVSVVPTASASAEVSADAESVRYFAVWSYTQNAPSDEIAESALEGRQLGYWKLTFDDDGRVDEAAYHSSEGTLWLSVRYVAKSGHIYADVYSSQGQFVVRKSTQLLDRRPPE
jgi:hypothetical protein